MEPQRKSRFKRRALALSIGLAFCFLAGEGCLRILLFCDLGPLADFARNFRQPDYYADMRREDVYWKLQHIWSNLNPRKAFGPLVPTTGWVSSRMDPRTLMLADERAIGERRPVLLYGDSFAECVTPPDKAWQGLLEKSPEGKTHALINFGVSGFGTDQSLTMLESTIERYATRNPLVIFSIFLEEDPDRTMLNFRGHPKPRYELVGTECVMRPLKEKSATAWWDNHPLGVTSYAWLLFRGPRGPLPLEWQQKLSPIASDAQVIALNCALLERMHKKLEALHIEHVVLGFHGRMMLQDFETHQWREQFVRDACNKLGVHFLSSLPYLQAAADHKTELPGANLFVTGGQVEGHYNALGNHVVFEAIRQAIHGRYDGEDTSGVRAANGR